MVRGETVPLWRQLRKVRTEAVTLEQVVEIVERLLDERLGKKKK